jgi:uncharacterized protein (TIGR02118 family)
MAPRATGTTYEQFQHHWRSGHADVARELPGLRSYIQNHAVLSEGVPVLPYAGFDACSEIEFDDLEAMDAAFASEEYRTTVSADESSFIERERFMLALMRRRVLDGDVPPSGGAKLMTFWRAAPWASADELDGVLAGPYRECLTGVGALHHEQLVEIPGAHDGRRPAPFQVVDSVTFENADEALACLRGDAAQRAAWEVAGTGQAVARLLAEVVRVV